MTEFLTRTRFGRLDAEDARLLDDQGYLLLRGADTRYLTRSQVMELQG